jgi:transcription termination/antitermination protein NusA
VREVLVDDDAKQATVIVPDDQLSLAIGKDGLNARLAARLTGWRVDIRSETEFAEEEADMGFEDEEAMSGRCAAILANGKRCPNAALPGSRYCGLPVHQELEGKDTDHVVPVAGETEPATDAEETPSTEEEPAPAEQVAAGSETVGPEAEEEPVAEEPAAAEPAGPGSEPPVAEPEAQAAKPAEGGQEPQTAEERS